MHMRESRTRRLRGDGFPPGRRGAGKQERGSRRCPAVVVNPTFIPSRLRGFARNAPSNTGMVRAKPRGREGGNGVQPASKVGEHGHPQTAQDVPEGQLTKNSSSSGPNELEL